MGEHKLHIRTPNIINGINFGEAYLINYNTRAAFSSRLFSSVACTESFRAISSVASLGVLLQTIRTLGDPRFVPWSSSHRPLPSATLNSLHST